MIDQIIDIAEVAINIQHGGQQPGLMGSAIINEKATDVVDIGYYLNQVNQDWFTADHDLHAPYNEGADDNSPSGEIQKTGSRRVLLVDDSPFFRNMLTPLLTIAGYEVTPLESAQDALDLCEEGQKFDIIVSDIEMPNMDGFEFASKVKSDGSDWQSTPIIALTSHATEQDIERGKAVGFNEYIAKFDRDHLLKTISSTLNNQLEGAS